MMILAGSISSRNVFFSVQYMKIYYTNPNSSDCAPNCVVHHQESLPGESILLRLLRRCRLRFGHSDIVLCLFLVMKIQTYGLSIISKNA